MRLAVGTVHAGHVTYGFYDSMCRLVSRMPVLRLGMRAAANVSAQRNDIVREALRHDVTHLLTVDTDIVFTADDVNALVADDLPIVSALIYGQHETGEQFVVGHLWDKGTLRRIREEEVPPDRSLPPGVPFPVASVGAGFCLIQRRVLEDLEDERPPGRILWPYAQIDSHGAVWSEDTTFCRRARENANHRSYIDPRVRVKHVKDHLI